LSPRSSAAGAFFVSVEALVSFEPFVSFAARRSSYCFSGSLVRNASPAFTSESAAARPKIRRYAFWIRAVLSGSGATRRASRSPCCCMKSLFMKNRRWSGTVVANRFSAERFGLGKSNSCR
jgi:hypothetical protein